MALLDAAEKTERIFVLKLSGIVKNFPGTKALDGASLNVYAGKVMGLLGENGAGKSTLMKIIVGIYAPDQGQMVYHGKKTQFDSVKASKENGIVMVHQEPSILPELNLAENILLGREPMKNILHIDYKTMHGMAGKLLRQLCINKQSTDRASGLSIGDQKMIEIAKALAVDAEVIIMDEPTDALVDTEVQRLFEIIQQLCRQGKSIIYISHRLEEVSQICDDVTIMRDGKFIAESPIEQISHKEIIAKLVGREVTVDDQYKKSDLGQVILKAESICNRYLKPASFQLHQKEVLGIFGLMGAGRTELAKTLYGMLGIDQGVIYIDGQPLNIDTSTVALKNGIVYISEDRKAEGLVLGLSVLENISLSALPQLSNKWGKINAKSEKAQVSYYIDQLKIKTSSVKQLVKNLSGGNQQKVAIAKGLICQPKVLILDEPTRGVDIGAKGEIYRLIHQLKAQGLGIILVSSEIKEIMALSDRVLVMLEGEITAELPRENLTQEKMMQYAMG